MPAEDWGWRITPDELRAWIVEECDGVVILNKPAGVVCHPSKKGPWSSLAGAYREYFGVEKVHMPFRLDRETSGVMIVTGVEECGRRLQRAVQKGAYRKTYLAVLMGELRGESLVALRLDRADGDWSGCGRRRARMAPGRTPIPGLFRCCQVSGAH